MAQPKVQRVYQDVNRNTGLAGPPLLDDMSAVLNSVFNILNTEVGEREFLPEFGSILSSYLQDPLDDDTAVKIRYNLVAAVRM